MNKIDRTGGTARREQLDDGVCIHRSAKQGNGIDLLERELLTIAHWQDGDDVFTARERHLDALRRARDHLGMARERADELELFAEELRSAHRSLQEITGEYTPDDLLGAIFGTFCIGK